MKNFAKFVSIVGLYVFCSMAWADKISGVSRADFLSNELTVPCVQIVNSDDAALNDQFFDVILERRGNSFNYELIFAESEDQAHCQRVADFAAFDDDAASELGVAKILVSCEKRSDRSKISVDGKELASGDYSATVTSGTESAVSLIKSTVGDEIEFDFDSSANDVAQGATEISADFIQNGIVDAEIADNSGNPIVSVTNVLCAVRD
jgi:hypothetical protein